MVGPRYKMYFDFPEVQLDCHGMRSYEVEEVVDKFLDSTYLQGKSSAEIIHGIGNGVLKEIIVAYLKRSSYVDSFFPSYHGSSVIVYLK
jgi:DNA mismatch repair protein MutS2